MFSADGKNQSSKLSVLLGLTTLIKFLLPSGMHMWPWPTTVMRKLTKPTLPRVASAVPRIAPAPLALSTNHALLHYAMYYVGIMSPLLSLHNG